MSFNLRYYNRCRAVWNFFSHSWSDHPKLYCRTHNVTRKSEMSPLMRCCVQIWPDIPINSLYMLCEINRIIRRKLEMTSRLEFPNFQLRIHYFYFLLEFFYKIIICHVFVNYFHGSVSRPLARHRFYLIKCVRSSGQIQATNVFVLNLSNF